MLLKKNGNVIIHEAHIVHSPKDFKQITFVWKLNSKAVLENTTPGQCVLEEYTDLSLLEIWNLFVQSSSNVIIITKYFGDMDHVSYNSSDYNIPGNAETVKV